MKDCCPTTHILKYMILQLTMILTPKNQPLMMAYERSGSAWNNFGKFIHQFQPETKTLIRKLKRILIKLYRQNVSLLFNQTCLNERLLANYTHTHTHIYIYIFIKQFSNICY